MRLRSDRAADRSPPDGRSGKCLAWPAWGEGQESDRLASRASASEVGVGPGEPWWPAPAVRILQEHLPPGARVFETRRELIETMARLAPPAPVRSLREGTRAHALRYARTCYDHLAGRLGVAIFSALLDHGLVTGGDGRHHPELAGEDRLPSPGRDIAHRLTPAGHDRLTEWGRALTRWLVDSAWIERLPGSRAVRVTELGVGELHRRLGVRVPSG